MAETNTFTRALHDLGLAAWFGGSLMGAVGLNAASGEVSDRRERSRVADAGWARWTPASAAAIGAHILGSMQLTRRNKARLGTQRGVGTAAIVKGALTAAALGATAYSRMLGQKIMDAEAVDVQRGAPGVAVEDATTPAPETSDEVARTQQQLKVLQWLVPALTGAVVVVNAWMGEQQRPLAVASGVIKRLRRD